MEKRVEKSRRSRIFGQESPVVARGLMMLAGKLERNGRRADAIEVQREYVAMLRRHEETDKLWLADAQYYLATMLMGEEQFDEAGELFVAAMKVYKDAPKRKRDLLQAQQWLARVVLELGNWELAGKMLTSVAQRLSDEYGEDDDRTGVAISELAGVNARLGNYEKSFELMRTVISRRSLQVEPDDPRVLRARSDLATYLHWAGREEEAKALATEVLDRQERTLGAEHEDTKHSAGLLDAIGRSMAE